MIEQRAMFTPVLIANVTARSKRPDDALERRLLAFP
jgi:hypothetical protein